MKSIAFAGLVATAALFWSTESQAQSMRPVLDFETADAIRDHCLAHAKKAGHAVVVAVFDQNADLVSFANHATSQGTSEVAQWKGRSAAMYRRSTRETASWNLPTVPMIATVEGGVPLFTPDGVPLGGVGVSGAPSEFDAECATRAAEAAGLRVSRANE